MEIPPSQTLIYKCVKSLNIELELYPPPSPQNAPVLLWFHGGGLLQGQRRSVAPHMLRGIAKHKYALISADYRLAPQARAAEILTDVLDCIKYIRTDLLCAAKLQASEVDVSKLAVSGSSAGGYLALLAGLYASPAPDVVLALYPITDPWGPFFTSPQPHPDGPVERAGVAEFLDRKGEVVAGSARDSPRGKMYRFMMQSANLGELLGITEADVMFRVGRAVAERGRGDLRLPPVYVVHGDADRFVGVEQADEVVEVLRDVEGRVEYERLPGLDHLFDVDEKVELEGMYTFMKRYV